MCTKGVDRDASVWTQAMPMYRYMGLSDLMKEIKADPQSYYGDEAMEMKVLRQVLSLVEDKISEVKNQAVKWCVSLTRFRYAAESRSVWVSLSRSSVNHRWSLSWIV